MVVQSVFLLQPLGRGWLGHVTELNQSDHAFNSFVQKSKQTGFMLFGRIYQQIPPPPLLPPLILT